MVVEYDNFYQISVADNIREVGNGVVGSFSGGPNYVYGRNFSFDQVIQGLFQIGFVLIRCVDNFQWIL
ncbi:hypothetical protein D3C84_1161790 [compost metagenome]